MEPRLFVSFWNIALSNLPVGSFRRRALPTAEARRLIHVARASEVLLCVAQEDLGAPYSDGARERHRELCAALRQHADIEIELKDFFGQDYANPLCFAQVGEQQSLLVVDCHYVFDDAPRGSAAAAPDPPNHPGGAPEEDICRRVKEGAFKMSIAPDSIAFYVFEQVGGRHESSLWRPDARAVLACEGVA